MKRLFTLFAALLLTTVGMLARDWYTELEYIECTGGDRANAFITSYHPTTPTVVKVGFQQVGKNGWAAVFCARNTHAGTGISLYINGNDNAHLGYFTGDTKGAGDNFADYEYGARYDVEAHTTYLKWKKEGGDWEEKSTGNTAMNETENNLALFANPQWDNAFVGRIYYVDILEDDNGWQRPVYELKPMMRHDGALCFADERNNEFVFPALGNYDNYTYGAKPGTTIVSVDKKSVVAKVGESVTVTASGANEFTWTSDNEGVATVENGVIKAVGVGTCKVTCSTTEDHGWNLTVNVEVIPNTVAAEHFTEWNGTDEAVLPAVRHSGDDHKWAYTWFVNSGKAYDGAFFNHVFGAPVDDEDGNAWYAADYTMTNDEICTWSWNNTIIPNGWPSEMSDVYVRRYFKAEGDLSDKTIYMAACHDDSPCEYYINGVLVWSRTGWEPVVNGWYEDEVVCLTDEQKALIKTDGSVNVFAYHMHQNWGGRYADGGLYTGGKVANLYLNEGNVKRLKSAVAGIDESLVAPELLAAAKAACNWRQDAGYYLDQLRYAVRMATDTREYKMESAVPADGMECWIYNVGAQKFLAGGNDWGTHTSLTASLNAWPFILHANTSGANRFSIQTNLPNGVRGGNDWLGHNGYVDCGGINLEAEGWAWEFEAVGDGTYRIINCEQKGDDKYLGMTEDRRLQVDTNKTDADNKFNLWKVITKEQLELMYAAATVDDGLTDVTYMIHQNAFCQNDFEGNNKDAAGADMNDSKWERNAGSVWNWKNNNADGDYCYEMWNTQGEVYLKQTVEGLLPGKYIVACNGLYRDGNWESAVAGNRAQLAYLYAGTRENAVALPNILDYAGKGVGYGRLDNLEYLIPDGCADVAHFFQLGCYKVQVEVEVGEDGKLEFGVFRGAENVKERDWIVVDNFHLYYKGAEKTFEADGVAGNRIDTSLPFTNEKVHVDAYDNNTIYFRAWDGVEGSDLRVVYANVAVDDENVTRIINLEQIVDGKVVSEFIENDEDPDQNCVMLMPQSKKYPAAYIYVSHEMTQLGIGEGEEAGMGQLMLYGYWLKGSNVGGSDDNMGVDEPEENIYMVSWPGEPVPVPSQLYIRHTGKWNGEAMAKAEDSDGAQAHFVWSGYLGMNETNGFCFNFTLNEGHNGDECWGPQDHSVIKDGAEAAFANDGDKVFSYEGMTGYVTVHAYMGLEGNKIVVEDNTAAALANTERLYIVGEHTTDWSRSSDVCPSLEKVAEGVYSGVVNIKRKEAQFDAIRLISVADNGNSDNYMAFNCWTSLGNGTYKLQTSTAARFYMRKGTVKITVDVNKGTFTTDYVDAEPTYMYAVGTLVDATWQNTNTLYKLDEVKPFVFQGIVKVAEDGDSRFSLFEERNSDSWTTGRHGPEDQSIKPEQGKWTTNNLVTGQDRAWRVPAGTWMVTFDLNKNRFMYDEALELAYETTAETTSVDWEDWGESAFAGMHDIKVEGYTNNTMIVRSFMGTEGYDLKLTYDVDDEGDQILTSVTPIIDGQAGETTAISEDAVWVNMYTGHPKYYYAQFYVPTDYAGLWSDAEEGYVLLQGYFNDRDGNQDFSYYMLEWPQAPAVTEVTLTELAALPTNEEGVYVKVSVDGAKITAAFDQDDYFLGFVENDEAGVQAILPADYAGKAVTGTVTGLWADYGNGAMLVPEDMDVTMEDVDVTTGLRIADAEELQLEQLRNRLVTATNTAMCPITVEDGMIMVGNTMVYDIYMVLGYDYVAPAVVESVTGVVVNMMGQNLLVPRSAADIVGVAAPTALTLGEVIALQSDDEIVKGASIQVEGAKITAVVGSMAFLEDETGAIILGFEDGVPEGLVPGVTVTGTFKADVWVGQAYVDAIDYTGVEFGITDVTKGKVVASAEELTNPANYNRLLTVVASEATPMVDAEGLVLVGGVAFLYDVFEVLGEDFNYPTAASVKSATGILFHDVEEGTTFFVPRSESDLELDQNAINDIKAAIAAGEVYNLAGQKVNNNFKGVVIINGKKMLKK